MVFVSFVFLVRLFFIVQNHNFLGHCPSESGVLVGIPRSPLRGPIPRMARIETGNRLESAPEREQTIRLSCYNVRSGRNS